MAHSEAHAHEDCSHHQHHGEDGEDSSHHHDMTNQDWLNEWEKGEQWEFTIVDQ